MFKCRVFQCIKQHNLPFYILYKTKQHIGLAFVIANSNKALKKIVDDLQWTPSFFIAFLALVEQQRQEYAGFFNPVKRK